MARLMLKRVAVFVGAGASMDSPSELPSAPALAEYFIGLGLGLPGSSLEAIAEESYARTGSWQEFAQALPLAQWRVKPCNAAHHVIAELAAEGIIRCVFTTNWDTLIERGLAETGIPYSPVVTAENAAVAHDDSVQVFKIHGCVDHPERLRARESELADAEWAAVWANAVFESRIRNHSILFVGYSGAAAAVTESMRQILMHGDRGATDFLVDPRPLEAIHGGESGARFLEALHLADDSFIRDRAAGFFGELRVALFPKLLRIPLSIATTMLDGLGELVTDLNGALTAELTKLQERWLAAGPLEAQHLLAVPFVSQMIATERPYLPITTNADIIARMLAWIAIGRWSGQVDYSGDGAVTVDLIDPEGARSAIMFGFAKPTQPRSHVAYQVAAAISSKASGGPVARYVGVMLGGIGALPPGEVEPRSMARTSLKPSVARGGGTRLRWYLAEAVFDQFHQGVAANDLADQIRAALAAFVAPAA